MSASPLRDLADEIAEMIEWCPKEEPIPDHSQANDHQIEDAGIDAARWEVAQALRPHVERFEAARAHQPALYDLRMRIRRGEFEAKGPFPDTRARIAELGRQERVFAEAVRAAFGPRAVAHEQTYLTAKRLADDRRQRILGRTWKSNDEPCAELPQRCHLLEWYRILNSAACSALGYDDEGPFLHDLYPRPPQPETTPSDGRDP